MYIYKITNLLNGKIYIGQTINTIEKRFKRHIQDALKHRKDTHLACAIRKYGPKVFVIEVIDTASSQEQLTQKEHDYIVKYNSVKLGYNETDSMLKCGGNTFISKTPQEMIQIRRKISLSQIGGKNANARKIARINWITNSLDYFDTLKQCMEACGLPYKHLSFKQFTNSRQVKSWSNTYSFLSVR